MSKKKESKSINKERNTLNDVKVAELRLYILSKDPSSAVAKDLAKTSNVDEIRGILKDYASDIVAEFKRDVDFKPSALKKILQGHGIKGSSGWTAADLSEMIPYLSKFLKNIEDTATLDEKEAEIQEQVEKNKKARKSEPKRISAKGGIKSTVRMTSGQSFDDLIKDIDDAVNRLIDGKKLSSEDKTKIAILGAGQDKDFFLNVEDDLNAEAGKLGANIDDAISIGEHLKEKYPPEFAAWVAYKNDKPVVSPTTGKRKSPGDLWKAVGNIVKEGEFTLGKALGSIKTGYSSKEYAGAVEELLKRTKGLEGKYFKHVADLKKQNKKPRKGSVSTQKDLDALIDAFDDNKDGFLGKDGVKEETKDGKKKIIKNPQREKAIKLLKTLESILLEEGDLTSEEKEKRKEQLKTIQYAQSKRTSQKGVSRKSEEVKGAERLVEELKEKKRTSTKRTSATKRTSPRKSKSKSKSPPKKGRISRKKEEEEEEGDLEL